MNCVKGRVVATPSLDPVSNVLVVVYDLDPGASGRETSDDRNETEFRIADAAFPGDVLNSLGALGDRIGSVLTDQNGEFELQYDDAEFRIQNQDEKRPDLYLLVLAPESPGASAKDLLLFHSSEIRRNAGKTEHFHIQVPERLLKEKGVPFGPSGEAPSNESRIAAYARRETEEREYVAGTQKARVAAINGALTEFQTVKNAYLDGLQLPAAPALPGRATLLPPDKKVAEVQVEHVAKEVETINQIVAKAGPEARGIEVTLLLNDADRADLGIGPNSPQLIDLTPAQFEKLRAKLDFAGSESLVLTSENPILKHCLARSPEVEETIDILRPRPPEASGPEPPKPDLPNALTTERIDALLAAILQGDGSLNLQEELPTKADSSTVNSNIDRISLSKGPAEQTAYYDFNVLNVAFGHVWKHVVDTTPAAVGAVVAGELKRRGIDFVPSRLHDLLISANVTLAMDDPPPKVIAEFEITREEWSALPPALRVKLEKIADDIEKANAGLIYMPEGHLTFTASGLTVRPSYEPPGYVRASPAAAERFKAELRQQGETILDYVRSTNVRSLHGLLRELDIALKSKYSFTVFGADESAKAINFGLLNTYRQRWEPVSYQVGDLVRSVPLAPKEERKYNVKQVLRTKRVEKEARKNNSTLSQEQSSTGRAEEDIVNRAQNKGTFNLTGSYDSAAWKISTALGTEAHKESQQNRKSFREAVLKAAQEFKEERSIDITVEVESEVETQESGTISNPNDELAVTYLFYELQKRFKVSEQLFRILPVVLVAQPVPEPAEITDAWIVAHDWILNRVLLDDSFRPALQHLGQRNVGDDFAVRELRKNLRLQRQTVEQLRRELATERAAAENRYRALEEAITKRIGEESEVRTDGAWENFKEWFGGEDSDPEAAKARELAARDAHQFALERVEKVSAALQRELHALNQATEEFNKAYREHLDRIAAVARLKTHIKDNIIYYMQAIWTHENEDQRLMRLLGTQVPTIELESVTCTLETQPLANDLFKRFRASDEFLHRAWVKPRLRMGEPKPLEEVADLGRFLGFVGNYMVFPLRTHNALTEIMAMPYVDASFGAMDPDQLSNISLEEYARYVKRLRDELAKEEFDEMTEALQGWLKLLLSDPLRNGDEIVVPTNSLYIEVMTSKNTLMEDFKLLHRQLDVEKVRAENRDRNAEVLRKAKRIVLEQLDDPSIDKRIIIAPGLSSAVVVGPEPA